MELLQDGGDVVGRRGFGDDTGSGVVDQLKFMERRVRETEEEGVAVIQTGGDETVDEDGGGVGGEGGAETIDVAEVEIGSASGKADVGFKRKRTVKDDTQTLDLR